MIEYDGGRLWGGYRLKCEAPVLEVDFGSEATYPNGDVLPGVWITEPVEDPDGNALGRTYTALYPGPEGGDPDGEDALYYGGRYYDEGMGYSDPADREKRVDCFRAAELLYRHAAGKGNVVANLCLGYVYSYDRCEGRYWVDPMTLNTEEDYRRPYPREERAFECFSIAAEADIPEACYKLGDMYRGGIGCEASGSEAYSCYSRAYMLSLGRSQHPAVLGSIALRLATCYEEGLGCPRSPEGAMKYYPKAIASLEAAVEAGEDWYCKALANARAGAKRCEQEIALRTIR